MIRLNKRHQKLKAYYRCHVLQFKKPAATSRGMLTCKKTWLIYVGSAQCPENRFGVGECSLLPGLSKDDVPEYESVLQRVCEDINNYEYWLTEGLLHFPSIRFGLETALLDYTHGARGILFPSLFTEGKAFISINGLIWMDNKEEMRKQIDAKLQEGYTCLKMKIGAIDFEDEIALLQEVREKYPANIIEIRVDANGAFAPQDALEKLKKLSELHLHSIEQPVRPGQLELISMLCRQSPLPIALDEELITSATLPEKKKLLEQIAPAYIVLKPSLLGGFAAVEEWISLASQMGIGWWITSALESNIGLNAIAQWTFTLNNLMPQGLGTGQLYVNNFDSPLTLRGDKLYYIPNQPDSENVASV
jgi:o-succinylbenzoate synthase